MKFNITFTVVARCKKFIKEDRACENPPEVEDITLELSKQDASNLVFRFNPSTFTLGKYKVFARTDEMGNLKSVLLTDDKYLYIVTNPIQLLVDVVEGFIRITTTERITQIMEISTISSEDDEIVDEFDVDGTE